jgi:hypothetical protein
MSTSPITRPRSTSSPSFDTWSNSQTTVEPSLPRVKIETKPSVSTFSNDLKSEASSFNSSIVRPHSPAASSFNSSIVQTHNPPTMSAYKFTPPPRFAGSVTENPKNDALLAESWLDLMDSYLIQMKLTTSHWSDELSLAICLSFMDLDARRVAKRAIDELGSAASWSTLQSRLRAQFCPPISAMAALEDLYAVKQESKLLATYIREFDNALEVAMSAGYRDALGAAKLFLDHMSPELNLAVTDALTNMIDDPWPLLSKQTAPEAVRWLAALSTRRNEFVMRSMTTRKSRLAAISQSAVNGSQSVHASASAANSTATTRSRDARSQRSSRDAVAEQPIRDSKVIGRENLVNALCRRYGLEANIVRQRLDAGVCARCAQHGHDIRGCPSGSQSAANSSTADRSNVPARQ